MAEPAEYGDGDQRMDLDKWGGQGISLATDENHVRCQAYRNAFYSCAAKTHIDLQDEKCQSYWLDARECFFGRRMVEKLKVLELMKAQRLKEAGYKREWFGEKAPLFQEKEAQFYLGKPKVDFNEKVSVKINHFN